MAFIAKRRVKGTNYFSLVKSERVNGKPRQEVVKHLGRYTDAVSRVKRMRSLSSEIKQKYLTRLAELEGLLESGVALPKKAYECIVIDPAKVLLVKEERPNPQKPNSLRADAAY